MPVGTQGTVKGIWPEHLERFGASIVLGNTYHLENRPGSELVRDLGGLHAFCGWRGPMLTDSGGFQVFSLKDLRKISEDGVEFRSHVDGRKMFLGPETATQVQNRLGADIIMAFDECPPLPGKKEEIEAAVERTGRWLKRCFDAHQREDQMLFGIVQGGLDRELRLRSLELTMECDPPGVALGGLSVGESREERLSVLDSVGSHMPEDRPRYLMGVGTPLDLIESVERGIDMFDCVLPSRDGRHGVAYTYGGKLRLKNTEHKESKEPLEHDCPCPACERFSRAYLRHLLMAGEILGATAVSLHNLCFFLRLMRDARTSLENDDFKSLSARIRAAYLPSA